MDKATKIKGDQPSRILKRLRLPRLLSADAAREILAIEFAPEDIDRMNELAAKPVKARLPKPSGRTAWTTISSATFC